ncbi:MAG: 50S ribosomal protein L32 [Bdellovibrionales bacterium]|nr:50S ribosomal protein L32 [Bdellovibrionales bacterium]
MRRGHGRAHFFLTPKTFSVVKETGEFVMPHRVSPMGFYKGKKIFKTKEEVKSDA